MIIKFGRLVRLLTRVVVAEFTAAGVKLSIGGSLHDPTDPVGRLLFNVVAMIAEFSDLLGTRPGAHTGAKPAELFAVACSTACRGVQRAGAPTAPAAARTSAAGG